MPRSVERERMARGPKKDYNWFRETYGEDVLLRIAHLFFEQKQSPKEIAKELKKLRFDVNTHFIQDCLLPGIIRSEKWITLKTVVDNNLARKIKTMDCQLSEEESSVRVTAAALTEAVATHCADMVSGMIWEMATEQNK